jgi:trehalose 6-phosphate phosphatase
MTAAYLFHEDAQATLARYVKPDTLFAFDLDGTLAPIVEDYAAAKVAESVRATLKRLSKLAKVVVLTGRSRKDALAVLGFEPLLLIGNHGAEWPSLENSRNKRQTMICLKWRERLHAMLRYEQGVEIEFKGESLSVHYRKASDPESALAKIEAATETLDPVPRRIGGKYVVNLLPLEASTKGKALVAAMDRFELKRVIFFGDDVTDEEVFQLSNINLFGIHIGKESRTAAAYYLNDQSEMPGLLDLMVAMLETCNAVETQG